MVSSGLTGSGAPGVRRNWLSRDLRSRVVQRRASRPHLPAVVGRFGGPAGKWGLRPWPASRRDSPDERLRSRGSNLFRMDPLRGHAILQVVGSPSVSA
jgi:hypothetical protein